MRKIVRKINTFETPIYSKLVYTISALICSNFIRRGG